MRNRAIIMLLLFLFLLGCTSDHTFENLDNLGFSVYVPEYVPKDFKMVINMDTDKKEAWITYSKEQQYIEIQQKVRSKYNYNHFIRNYFLTQSNQVLEKNEPLFRYLEIGNFVGEVNVSLEKHGVFSFVFVPTNILNESVLVNELPYYEIQSNMDKNEVIKVINSLQKIKRQG
ncbi:hypothetical protein [Brevibacillus sp. NRS-1366]|uniref:hypothetical protein n=1 Tax=Brevibacillus sp. NRS-1366 TaxID=3233899 RepID=UPI003D20BCE8